MDTSVILVALDEEIARLQKVRALLAPATNAPRNTAAAAPKGPGRPKKVAEVSEPKKRQMTAEGRAKIAAAQKERWARLRRIKKA
jgi:hypothetical protein